MSLQVSHGAAVRPCAGFTSCGDATAVVAGEGSRLYLVLDALGHGPDAEHSAVEACRALQTLGSASLGEAFLVVDHALASLREVVMAGIQVDSSGLRFAGVGNVEVIGPAEVARPACQVGRVGRGVRSLREVELPATPGTRWVLASDGLRPRLLREAFDTTRSLGPAEAAARLLELAGRDNDDASVLVLDLEAGDGS